MRCIRRAVDEAEKDGKDDRVLVLACAAAEMTNRIESMSGKLLPHPRSRR